MASESAPKSKRRIAEIGQGCQRRYPLPHRYTRSTKYTNLGCTKSPKFAQKVPPKPDFMCKDLDVVRRYPEWPRVSDELELAGFLSKPNKIKSFYISDERSKVTAQRL